MKEVKRIIFQQLPEDQWLDSNGDKVLSPVFRLTIRDIVAGTEHSFDGPRVAFEELVNIVGDVLRDPSKTQALSEVKNG